MDRRAKVVAIAERIEAADDLKKLKDKRDAEERKDDVEDLKPDDYRAKHGRCPKGYEYDPFEDKCLPTEKAPDEAAEDEREEREQEEKDREKEAKKREKKKKKKKAEDKPADKEGEPKEPEKVEPFKWADTPEERKKQRKERRDRLQKLFEEKPDEYDKEVDRMRASGELPDEETSKLLAQVDKIESLPEEILNDKEKLKQIVEQQDAQREHEELMLEKTEKMLTDFETKRQRALDAGKRPPKLNAEKLMIQVENMYGRKLPERSEKMKKVLEDESDAFSKMVSESGQNPGSSSYWWKKWFERMVEPLPVWTPGGRETSQLVGHVLDEVAVELDRRGSAHIAAAVDLAGEALAATAKTVTSAVEVGQSWDAVGGKRTVVKIDEAKGLAFVKQDGMMGAVILPVAEIPSEIEFDTKQLASRQKQRKAAEDRMAQEEAERAKRENTYGFTEKMSAMQRRKSLDALLKQRRMSGDFTTVKELVERLYREGWSVEPHDKFKRVASKGDRLWTQRDVTKVGLDYLQFLRDKRPTISRYVRAKTMTSPGVTDMEPRELGFPPYDRDRPVPKHVPNEPSGRLAFPPYGPVDTIEYPERDSKMQGFPPYDGKGEPHDTETIGLPPYNSKAPHMGRGFPPYHDGKNVYEQRQETVDHAVSD